MHYVVLHKIDPSYIASVILSDALCKITPFLTGLFHSALTEFLEGASFDSFVDHVLITFYFFITFFVETPEFWPRHCH